MSDADVDFFTPLAKQKQTVTPKATVKSAAPSEPITSNKDYESIITSDLLDKIRHVESRGKPYAINPTSKAMGPYQFMPEQIVTMHKQGIKFNPLDEAEARNAATIYLKQLANRNKGDINKVLAQYGGFVTKDPSGYINDVMNAKAAKEEHPDVSFFKPLAKPEPVVEKPIEDKAAFGIYPRMAGSRQTIEARQPPSFKDIPAEAAAIGDVVAGAPAAILGTAGYGALRLAGRTPEQAQQTAQSTAGLIANPIGKLTGTEQTPAYQQSQFTAPLRQLGTGIHSASEQLGKSYGVAPQDIQFGMESGLMLAPKIVQGMGKVGGAMQDVRSQMAQQLAAKQAQAPQPVNPQFQSGGAAAVAHENAVRSALSEARPDLQASLANKNPLEITPQELKAIEIHNKFAKVDKNYVPTEAQALQDTAKLSDEYNLSSKPGYEDLRAKFVERDPFLIKGFNNVKEEFAPSHSGVGQQGKANNILEEVKTNRVDVDKANIENAYKALQTSDGKFAVDMKQASENALNKINAEDRLDKLPKTIKDKLDKYISGAEGNLNKFEHLRTDVASEQRLANRQGDSTTSHVLGLVRDALEELPMKGENAIEFKAKADLARNLFKNQKDLLDPKKPTYNKLYAMAFEDNRTPTEVMMGNVPHPGATGFFENFIAGKKTTPADLSRAIELVGKDTPAHHEIIAGLADHLKQKAGVIDDKGNVSQAALRRELDKLGPRLDLIAGSEVANRLKNIGDVAELSEHVRNKAGGSANVSQSAKTIERQAAQEVLGGLAETGLNVATGGKSGAVAAILKPMFKARQERQAAEAAQKAQQESVNRMVSPTAGINAPARVELRNMLPNRP